MHNSINNNYDIKLNNCHEKVDILNNELRGIKSNNAKVINDTELDNKNKTFHNNKMITEKIESEEIKHNNLQSDLLNQVGNLNEKNYEIENCKNMLIEENVQTNNDVSLITNKYYQSNDYVHNLEHDI